MQREQYELNWKDYYEILQVSPNAEPVVIKATFTKLAQTYHPDTSKDPEASVKMSSINEAYEVLSDPARRSAYDRVFRTKQVNDTTTIEREPPHAPPKVVERPLPLEQAFSQMSPQEIEDRLIGLAEALYAEREKELGSENMRVVERLVMLRTIDNLWVEHLTAMEHMREGIGLHAIAQRDPLVAYKTEGHNQFQDLLLAIQHDVAHTIYHVKIERRGAPQTPPSPMAKVAVNREGTSKQQPKVSGKKIGRNDPCPCGSGKKYKHCCGR